MSKALQPVESGPAPISPFSGAARVQTATFERKLLTMIPTRNSPVDAQD